MSQLHCVTSGNTKADRTKQNKIPLELDVI